MHTHPHTHRATSRRTVKSALNTGIWSCCLIHGLDRNHLSKELSEAHAQRYCSLPSVHPTPSFLFLFLTSNTIFHHVEKLFCLSWKVNLSVRWEHSCNSNSWNKGWVKAFFYIRKNILIIYIIILQCFLLAPVSCFCLVYVYDVLFVMLSFLMLPVWSGLSARTDTESQWDFSS